MFTNLEHMLHSLDQVFTHLHDSFFDCIAMRYLEIWQVVMHIHYQGMKFWFFNHIKRLIRCSNPLCQQFFKVILIPRTLWNISFVVNLKNKGLTAAALTCFSNALWIVMFEDSSFCRRSESAPGSRIFFPEVTAISSAVTSSGDRSFIAT